jgi:hypothetical protein
MSITQGENTQIKDLQRLASKDICINSLRTAFLEKFRKWISP